MVTVKEVVAAINARKARGKPITKDEAAAEAFDLYSAIAGDIIFCITAISQHRPYFRNPSPGKFRALATVLTSAAQDINTLTKLGLEQNDVLAPMPSLARTLVRGLTTMVAGLSETDTLIAFGGMRDFLIYFRSQVILPLQQTAKDHDNYLLARGVGTGARSSLQQIVRGLATVEPRET